MIHFNDKRNELADYMNALAPESGWMEYDFSDSRQHEYALMMTSKFWDAKRYPGLFHILEMKRQRNRDGLNVLRNENVDENDFQDMFSVTSFGPDKQLNLMTSGGVGTLVGGYKTLTLTLLVTDEQGNVMASGSSCDMMGSFLTVDALPQGGGTQSTKVFSQLFYSGIDKNNNPVSGMTEKVPYFNASIPEITAPVKSCKDPYVTGAVNIGLGRLWTDPDVGKKLDYVWNESNTQNPVGRIPFVGSVVFQAPIQPNGFIKRMTIWVGNMSSGGAVKLSPADEKHVRSKFTVDPNDNCKLNWNLPGGTSVENPGDPIVFTKVPWVTDMKTYFNCQIIVALTNGALGMASIMSRVESGGVPNGLLLIDPISFVWHCLAEDTLVSMADGSRKKISDIVTGEKVVVDNKGRFAVVEYTLRGAHYGEVLRIHTREGYEIITTSAHVFIGDNGLVPASDLKVGDALLTVDGERNIDIVEVINNVRLNFTN